MDDLIVGGLTIPGTDLEERFETSGGPGGQHANRSSTAVRLRFDIASSSLPGEVREKLVARLGRVVEVSASESRSQYRNREKARSRLAEVIESGLAETPRRKATKPTKAAGERRLAEKRARADLKRRRRSPRPDDLA